MNHSSRPSIENVYQRISKTSQNILSRLPLQLAIPALFLLSCLVIYAYVILELMEPKSYPSDANLLLNIMAQGLTTLGVIISIVWTKLVRGSETQYEELGRQLKQFEEPYGLNFKTENHYSTFKLYRGLGYTWLIFWLLAFLIHGFAMLPLINDHVRNGGPTIVFFVIVSFSLLGTFIYIGLPDRFRQISRYSLKKEGSEKPDLPKYSSSE